MDERSHLLLDLIAQAAYDRQPETVQFLSARLARQSPDPVQLQIPTAAADPATVAPRSWALTAREVGQIVQDYIAGREIGETVTFTSIANHIAMIPGLILDNEIVPTERRERWRNQVSAAINRMREMGVLGRGEKVSHYVVLRRV